MKFFDRRKAGQKLAEELDKLPKIKNGIILALPRGGVVTAAEIATKLNLPLDILVTRKIGAPLNPEYAIAAVSEHEVILSKREKVNPSYLKEQIKKERQEIQRRMEDYRGNRPYPQLQGKTVILVDDGLATGLTMEVAIREVKSFEPSKIIVAVPVAPPETYEYLKTLADQVIVLNIESMFFAVGQFYESFEQVTDQEVKELFGNSKD